MGSMLKRPGQSSTSFPGSSRKRSGARRASRQPLGGRDDVGSAGRPRAADTTQLDVEQFATATNTEALDVGKPVDDVTEEDIERAIAEIQDAIRKVPR
jgi:hypothetical protein